MLVLVSLFIAFMALVYTHFAIANPENIHLVSALSFFIFGLVAWRKAISLKLETARAKLIAFLGTGGLFISAGFLTQGSLSHILNIIGYIFLIVGVVFMFINLYGMGYNLDPMEWIQVLIVFAVLSAVAVYMGLNNEISTLGWILTGLSLFLILIASAVLRIFWGSDLGMRWTIGVFAGILLAIATVSYASFMSTGNIVYSLVAHFFYTSSGVMMAILYMLPD